MASHGAAIGLLIGLWLFSRKNKMPYIWSLDRIMIPVGIGGAIVRFGNLFNSEIYGHPTDLPWGFQFIRNYKEGTNIADIPACHPTQIYEALCYILCFAILFVLYRYTKVAKREGFIFGAAMVGIFLSRFLIEFVKNNQEKFEDGMLLNMGQLLSLPFIVAGIAFMIWAWFSKRDSAVAEPADAPKAHTQKNKRHFKK
jgi:prolipoprotein diacylglyceryl transferase